MVRRSRLDSFGGDDHAGTNGQRTRLALVTVVIVQLVVFVAVSLTQQRWVVPVLPVWLSTIAVSEYVPPLPSQSDFALACAEGAPTVINAPNPIAAAARALGANLVKTIVFMGSMVMAR